MSLFSQAAAAVPTLDPLRRNAPVSSIGCFSSYSGWSSCGRQLAKVASCTKVLPGPTITPL